MTNREKNPYAVLYEEQEKPEAQAIHADYMRTVTTPDKVQGLRRVYTVQGKTVYQDAIRHVWRMVYTGVTTAKRGDNPYASLYCQPFHWQNTFTGEEEAGRYDADGRPIPPIGRQEVCPKCDSLSSAWTRTVEGLHVRIRCANRHTIRRILLDWFPGSIRQRKDAIARGQAMAQRPGR